MASRIKKSLVAPEQGYRHREHRSKKGRVKNKRYLKAVRIKLISLKRVREEGERKGKYIKP